MRIDQIFVLALVGAAAMIATLLGGIAASHKMRAALRYGAAALLVLVALRRSGERTGRLAERLEPREKSNEVQRQMPEVAAL